MKELCCPDSYTTDLAYLLEELRYRKVLRHMIAEDHG